MSGFRRIDTLIPYKEPEFRPRKKRLGALDPDKSVWSTAGQLGRYLLSGAGEEDIEEIARAAASSLLDAELEPAEPDALEARIIRQRVEGPCSTFRDPEGEGDLVVVAHDKASKVILGNARWMSGARTVGMKLNEAVGLAEIVESAGGLEGVRKLAEENARTAFLIKAKENREKFRQWEEAGLVTRCGQENEWGLRVDAWAEAHPKPGEVWYLRDDWRLYVEGTDEELAEEAEKEGRAVAGSVSERLMPYILGHEKFVNTGIVAGALLGAEWHIWQDEGERAQNREWAEEQLREAHTARVFEDKKNPDEGHVAAARNGFIGREFSRTEVDDRCDLAEFSDLQDELEARIKCGEIPQIDTASHDLRFRLLGRHRVIGLYFPRQPKIPTPCIAIDCRHPASLLHEFAHAYDYEHGQPSATDARFREEIMRPFSAEFRRMVKEGELPISRKKAAYYTTPTEVFARSWEVYASVNGFGGSFVSRPEEYAFDPAYKGLLDRKDAICAYFDGFARPREKAHLPTTQERAEELLNDDGRDNSGELRRMVASGSVDTAELAAYSPAAAERLDRLAEYEASLAIAVAADTGRGEQMSIFDCLDEEGR